MTFFSIRRLLAALALLLLLALPAAAQESLEIGELTPIELPGSAEGLIAELYCGPTQGSFRRDGATLDTGAPFVYFGQYDCWAMVAGGTLDELGPIGWIESAAADLPDEPQLAFDDALAVMIEEDTFLTDDPSAGESAALCTLTRGTQVTLLARFGDWAYVQGDIEGTPVRAFLPISAIL